MSTQPTADLLFRNARPSDVDAIMSLVQKRIEWMDAQGLHQWNETDYFGRYPRRYWQDNIGRFLVGLRGASVVVAIALYENDIRWEGTGATGPAFYLHHLTTDLSAKGAGAAMMLYVERYAAAHGVTTLRLDSAVGNEVLERYYSALGYRERGRCQDRLYHGILREKRLAV